jgi:hypothetical protein
MMNVTRRRGLVATAAGCIAVGFLLGSGPAMAIPGSAFESTDGNTTVEGTQDWASLAPATSEADEEDTQSGPDDESFTQGTKSDTPVPVIETGSIPPNKSDLTRMRIASETIDGDVIVYVAWNRSNTLGSANMNFEFNATTTPSANGVTPVRTEGDVLITFDFSGNDPTDVDLGLARWAVGPCVANGGKLPNCWGDFIDLDLAGYADGSVSADGRFGEAAINLTDAGVFAPNECTALGSAYLTSRSSDAFTAALKDFVPPAEISISTCGAFKIIKTAKHKDTETDPNLAATFEVKDSLDAVFATPSTDASTGEVCVPNVPPGTYTVTETDGADGYLPDDSEESVIVALSSTCTNTSVTFENIPLSKVTVTFESLVPGGTASIIECTTAEDAMMDPDGGADTGDAAETYDDTSEVYGNLQPGVYTCVIDVDP